MVGGDRFPEMRALSEFFSFFCHQLPSRSPHFDGAIFPLCYRCAGLHLGFLVSYLYLAGNGGWARGLPPLKSVVAGCLIIAPFFFDGWGNTLRLWDSPSWVRALFGVGVGIMLPMLLLPLARRSIESLCPTFSDVHALVLPIGSTALLLLALLEAKAAWGFKLVAFLCATGTVLFVINFALAVYRAWEVSKSLRRRTPAQAVLRLQPWT